MGGVGGTGLLDLESLGSLPLKVIVKELSVGSCLSDEGGGGGGGTAIGEFIVLIVEGRAGLDGVVDVVLGLISLLGEECKTDCLLLEDRERW